MPDLSVRRTSRNRILRLLLLGLLLLAATNLSGCASGGDRAAAHELDRVADSIAREAQQHWRRTVTDPVSPAVWSADDSHPMPTDTSGHKGSWVLVVIQSKPYDCAAGVRFRPDRPGANIEIVVPSPRIATHPAGPGVNRTRSCTRRKPTDPATPPVR